MEMNEFQIVGSQYGKPYRSPEFPNARIRVKVRNFFPCLDSWEYRPPRMGDSLHPDKEKREFPAHFYGKDCLKCNVELEKESGETIVKNASLVRSIRPGRSLNDDDVTWRTSCMSKDKSGVHTHGDEVTYDPTSSSHKMMWELASPEPISHEDQIHRLLDNAERLFEPRMSTRI